MRDEPVRDPFTGEFVPCVVCGMSAQFEDGLCLRCEGELCPECIGYGDATCGYCKGTGAR